MAPRTNVFSKCQSRIFFFRDPHSKSRVLRLKFAFHYMEFPIRIFSLEEIKPILMDRRKPTADVGTLFSSRYSENSSHAHTRRHPHTFTHTSAHLCTPMHTPHTLVHTRSSSRTHSSSSR